MRTIFSLGPIAPGDTGNTIFCFAYAPGEPLESEAGQSALAALRKLQARGVTEGGSCEPQLANEAGAVGLNVAPLKGEVVETKAAIAVKLDHGEEPGEGHAVPLVVELIKATSRYRKAMPWTKLPAAIIELDVKGVAPEGRPNEAVMMGESGKGLALALYYERGAVDQVEQLMGDGRDAEARAVPSLTLFLDDEPDFVARAVEAFTGIRVAPHLMSMREGSPVPVPREDLEVLMGALNAIVKLAEGKEGVGRSELSPELEVTARIGTRGAAVEEGPAGVPEN